MTDNKSTRALLMKEFVSKLEKQVKDDPLMEITKPFETSGGMFRKGDYVCFYEDKESYGLSIQICKLKDLGILPYELPKKDSQTDTTNLFWKDLFFKSLGSPHEETPNELTNDQMVEYCISTMNKLTTAAQTR
jgi:hypothetical protein